MAFFLIRFEREAHDQVAVTAQKNEAEPFTLAYKDVALARAPTEPRRADGATVELKLSQQELAEMTGTSRVSVNKQLKSWEEEGLVSTRRGTVTIHNADALDDFADLGL